ncbi:hypothetical protein SLE2022_018990 [Rubroshorea leprosula]
MVFVSASKSFFFFLISTLFCLNQVQARTYLNVLKFGASTDEKTNNSKAFLAAWNRACNSTGQYGVLIPAGVFLLHPVVFMGPCKGAIVFKIRGILKAPTDNSSLLDHWISFQYVDQLIINGGGSLNGEGASAWPQNNCSEDPNCSSLPVSMRLDFVTNSIINYITSINSKNFHFNIFACENITIANVRISAPVDSPNTDGIHLGSSTNIRILNSVIGTGDDCISIGPESKNINISNIYCGPGHGISIGSLGGSKNEGDVTGIIVRNCSLKGTSNGLRIKTWAPSYPLLVSNITFEKIKLRNVSNPIFIDQQYCPSGNCDQKSSSSVKIQDVKFKQILGTTNSQVAVNLQCSKSTPCQRIELIDINMGHIGGDKVPITSQCANAHGVASGKQRPRSCL